MSMTHHVRWGAPSLWLAGLSLSGLVSLAWAAVGDVTPYLVYNPTDSIAPGWYRLQPLRPPLPPLSVGSVVLVSPPVEAALLAAQRGYPTLCLGTGHHRKLPQPDFPAQSTGQRTPDPGHL
ncbi:hypothetical protein [Dickeya chrysanthemi]|uniref:hypothetical protein n=1 Tax=Dickeya chrysanthemi TaxID=556 RepID=UPI003CC6B826